MRDTLSTSSASLDTLAAYRKKPGEPKTVDVEGYYKKDGTYIKPHKRTARKRKINQQ